jgi:multidrug resistance efflux pump
MIPVPPVPRLRTDLVIREQPQVNGTAFVFKDPTAGRFFRFREPECFIARQLDGRTPLHVIRQRFQERFSSDLSAEALDQFIGTLRRSGLLEGDGAGRGEPSRQGRIRGTLLYLRLKAFDPDRLLARLAPRVRVFFTSGFLLASALLILLALATTFFWRDEIWQDLRRLWRFDALLLAWVTVLLVTTIHEFGHAFTCKHFGGEVHEMGFMLIYFQPALYCNVSDAWLFPEKSRRLWVTFAGAYTEIFVWALATLTWRIVEPGSWISFVAMVVMATSGIKTMFNLNPLIKLDGYYLLSDWLEIPNLRQKSLAYLRARLGRFHRPRMHGSAAHGSSALTRREQRVFLTYGLLAGTYSAWLLSSVALLFGSFLVERYQGWGFVLFTGVLVTAFQNPLRATGHRVSGMITGGRKAWKALGRRAKLLVPLLALLAVVLLLRLDLRVSGAFTILPKHNADIRAEVEGTIVEVYVREGETVRRGDLIALLSDRDYQAALEKAESEIVEKTATLRMRSRGATEAEIAVARTRVEKAVERLKFARTQLQRIERLDAIQLTSQKERDEVREQVAVREKEWQESKGDLRVLAAGTRPEEIEAIQAEIARLDAERRYLVGQLERVRILSPIDGVVTTHKPEEMTGQHVSVGDLIVEVQDLDSVSAEIAVSEHEISDVQIGQRVALRARATPWTSVEGRVTSIAPMVSTPADGQSGRTVIVTTTVENPSRVLKPQMTGHAKINCGKRPLIDLLTRRFTRYLRVEFWSWW